MASPVCSVCEKEIVESPNGRVVTYTGDDGIIVQVPCDDTLAALITKPEGDLWVCGSCYPDAASKRFSGPDLAEIHYCFGLDCQDHGMRERARECFLRALALVRKADYLAALGVVMDQPDEEIKFYLEALAVDPNCLIARLNLANAQRRQRQES